MANSTVVTLRVNTDLYNVIKAVAEKEDIPASFVIRRAIKRGLTPQHPDTSDIAQSLASASTAVTGPQKSAELLEEWE